MAGRTRTARSLRRALILLPILAVVACTVAPVPPTPLAVIPGPTSIPSPDSGCVRGSEGAADIERSNTYVDPHPLELETASPEEVGLDSRLLEAGAKNAGLSKAIASMLVIRDGKLVFERYFNGSEASHANSVASLSKSILSLLTGAAIKDGALRLDTPISQVLPADLVPRDDGITVRHLLTMSGGLEWDEGADSSRFDV